MQDLLKIRWEEFWGLPGFKNWETSIVFKNCWKIFLHIWSDSLSGAGCFTSIAFIILHSIATLYCINSMISCHWQPTNVLPVLVLYFHDDASVQTNVLSISRDVTCRWPLNAWSDTWPNWLHPRNPAIQIRLIHGTSHVQFKATIILPDTNSPERYACWYPFTSLSFSVNHLHAVLFVIMYRLVVL